MFLKTVPANSVTRTATHSIYHFVGMPYKGPFKGNRDAKGTRFTKNTYLGPLTRTFPAYFEHGMFPITGFHEIGTNKFVGADEDGVLIDMAVEVANRFHNMLDTLYNKGLLYFSGQAYQSGYAEADNGDLLAFVPAEGSAVVAPANFFAMPRDSRRSLFRSEFDIDTVEAFYRKRVQMEEGLETTPVVDPVGETPTLGLAQEIAAILQGAQDEGDPQLQVLRSIGTALTNVQSAQTNAEQTFARATDLQAQEQRIVAAMESRLSEMADSIRAMATAIADRTRSETTRSVLETLAVANPAEARQMNRAAADALATTPAPVPASQPGRIVIPIPEVHLANIPGGR